MSDGTQVPGWLRNTAFGVLAAIFMGLPTAAYDLVIVPLENRVASDEQTIKEQGKELDHLNLNLVRVEDKLGLAEKDPPQKR